ncbi:hypothetical protein M427DRAFT_132730 [Gonapodya prolifera JEL478]|uniref:F-box domain-containing protein n=1 Tax=Gonapodya prolifera (strain JEL478) TaxID=1344416 RepID=A0A139ANQ2_GONPJ|nr:hypothetical protein M427DRAFT_132730 [Gonapodya prolifera JEL478]|eukprot:KXS18366.1 hypothetical protein M427DRAFT_132730 [Gonapodya prolifera JEL478]
MRPPSPIRDSTQGDNHVAAQSLGQDGSGQQDPTLVAHARKKLRVAIANEEISSLSRDFTNLLGDEISLIILGYLKAPDLLTCSQLSRKWHSMSGDRLLWRKLFLSRFVLPKAEEVVGLTQTAPRALEVTTPSPNGARNNIQPGSTRYTVPRPNPIDLMRRRVEWKYLYELEHNWESGNATLVELMPPESSQESQGQLSLSTESASFPEQHVSTEPPLGCGPQRVSQASGSLTPHQSGSNTLLAITPDLLFTASASYNPPSVIKAWNSWSGELLGSFGAQFTTSPTALAIDENDLARDKQGRRSDRTSDSFHDHRIAVGYRDGSISVFQVTGDGSNASVSCVYTPDGGSSDAIISICKRGPLVVSCSSDFTVTVYLVQSPGSGTTRIELLQKLRSGVAWMPVALSVEPTQEPQLSKPSHTRNRGHSSSMESGTQTLSIVFSVPHQSGGWQPGVQQVILDRRGRTVRSKYFTPVSLPRRKALTGVVASSYDSECSDSEYEDEEGDNTEEVPNLPFRSLSDSDSDNDVGSSSRSATVSSIAYKRGYVVAGYTDGTVRVYAFHDSDLSTRGEDDLVMNRHREARTLYHVATFHSHTSQVASVRPDPTLRKLVTSGRDGTCHIHVLPEVPWRALRRKRITVANIDPSVGRQLSVVQYSPPPLSEDDFWNRVITFVCFDEGRIFGIGAEGRVIMWRFF